MTAGRSSRIARFYKRHWWKVDLVWIAAMFYAIHFFDIRPWVLLVFSASVFVLDVLIRRLFFKADP